MIVLPLPILLLLNVSLPKPSLMWDRAPCLEGGYRLRCSAPSQFGGSWFTLYREGAPEPVSRERAPGAESEVTFLLHRASPGDQFRCQYQTQGTGDPDESPLSDTANITDDHYPKPSISVNPSIEVGTGGHWLIRCWAPYSGISFVLYQSREFRMEQLPEGDPPTAQFLLENVTAADDGRYTCYYHSLTEPVVWSNASNALELRVQDTIAPEPFILEVSVDAASQFRVNCSVPPGITGGCLWLYRDGEPLARILFPPENMGPPSFNLSQEALRPGRELSCLYGGNESAPVWTQDLHTLSQDFTEGNMLRLGIAALILSLVLYFLADACQAQGKLGA